MRAANNSDVSYMSKEAKLSTEVEFGGLVRQNSAKIELSLKNFRNRKKNVKK